MTKWQDRANTLGVVPGKSKDQLLHLEQIARSLPLPDSAEVTLTSSTGKNFTVQIDDVCSRQLSRSGLIKRNDSGEWEPIDGLLKAFELKDSSWIARKLHNNVKYFGELLVEIGTDTRIGDLLESAGKYGLTWSSKDPIGRRITWAKCLGLIDQWTFGGPLILTASGEALIADVSPCTPDEASAITHVDIDQTELLPDPAPLVDAELKALDDETLLARRVIIGYIPRGMKVGKPRASSGSTTASPVEALRKIVELLGEHSSLDEFASDCMKEFGLKKASFDQTLHTVRNLGLIEAIAFNEYAPTDFAHELLAAGAELDLARYLHSKFSFVGEILAALEGPMATSDLVKVAQESYGLGQIDNQELRIRLGFLSDAELVERVDWTRYKISPLGIALLAKLPLALTARTGRQAVNGSNDGNEIDDDATTTEAAEAVELDLLTKKLKALSTNSSQNQEFEVVVAEAFAKLGFGAEHLGGKGGTDVILTTTLGPDLSYRVVVDAKTSSHGVIAESQVLFPALKKHKQDSNAEFGVIVAPGFTKRMHEWATENDFTLITVDVFARLIELHQDLPLTLIELRELFRPSGDAPERLVSDYENERRSRLVLSRIVAMLHEEAADDDPVGGGIISRSNLAYSLRRELKPRPDLELINSALALLESPLIRAAVIDHVNKDQRPHDGDTVRIADSPNNVRLRIARLGVDIEFAEEKSGKPLQAKEDV